MNNNVYFSGIVRVAVALFRMADQRIEDVTLIFGDG
jgi:hypothetical protein